MRAPGVNIELSQSGWQNAPYVREASLSAETAQAIPRVSDGSICFATFELHSPSPFPKVGQASSVQFGFVLDYAREIQTLDLERSSCFTVQDNLFRARLGSLSPRWRST